MDFAYKGTKTRLDIEKIIKNMIQKIILTWYEYVKIVWINTQIYQNLYNILNTKWYEKIKT